MLRDEQGFPLCVVCHRRLSNNLDDGEICSLACEKAYRRQIVETILEKRKRGNREALHLRKTADTPKTE